MGIGIPQLLTPPIESVASSAITLAQGAIWDYLTAETKWGIYYAGRTQQVILGTSKPSGIGGMLGQATSINGAKALLKGQLLSNNVYIDSVVSLNQKKGSDISNYRLETGGFATYNKVEKPRQIQVRLTKGGTEEERGFFLSWLETQVKFVSGTTNQGGVINIGRGLNNLFDIYVPEVHYTNMTLIDYTIMRESRSGVSIIIADCIFQEVMQVTMQYSTSTTVNSQNPSDLSVQNNSVQGNTPSPNALSKLKGLVGL